MNCLECEETELLCKVSHDWFALLRVFYSLSYNKTSRAGKGIVRPFGGEGDKSEGRLLCSRQSLFEVSLDRTRISM